MDPSAVDENRFGAQNYKPELRPELREPDKEPLWEPKHKIFLSHSGIQKAFTEHLCERLEAVHHFPFLDRRDDSLRKGVEFKPLLMKACRECRVAVLVLSEEFFTNSKWPMMELKEFVEEQKSGNNLLRILPLYFKITREEIVKKMESEGWKAAWERLKETDAEIDLGAWKLAVSKIIQDINGIEYRGMDEGEPAFIKRVVDAVCKLVLPDLKWDVSGVQSKDELCEPILKRLKEVEPVDKRKGRVRVVGLYGVGGVGKTTISRVICNEMYAEFGGKVCHVEFGSAKDLVELLKMVLRELTEASPYILDTVDHSKLVHLLKERMHRQKVFLVLDNVWDDNKGEAQMYLKAGYHEGSMVLVTSRSVDVLVKQLGISRCDCMQMPDLEKKGAINLFLQHTGRSRESIKTDDEWEIVGNCVDECLFGKGAERESWNGYHYHPLALKVLGMSLKVKGSESGNVSNEVVEWKESLEKLKSDKFNMLGEKKHPLFSVLRLGYDELREEHQHVFLDLVLIWMRGRNFFSEVKFEWKWLRIIHRKSEAEMWKIIDALKRQGVVEDVIVVDKEVKIRIHDLYLEFAEAEAMAPRGESNFERRRFLFVNEGIDPLELEDGSPPNDSFWPALKRLIIHGSKAKSLGNLDHYRNVEVLDLYDCEDLEEVDVTGMDNLRCLVAYNCKKLCKCTGIKMLRKLVILAWEVRHPDVLDDLSFLTALQVLKLHFMDDFMGPSKVLERPVMSSVRSLTKLHDLSLMGWHEINDLGGVCELTLLQRLNVRRCVRLSKLSDLGKLTQLVFLDVSGCVNLTSLSGIGHATALRHLNASHCGLKELADEDFITLKQLEFLDVSLCGNLTSLSGIGHATALRHLNASNCWNLITLPADLSRFGKLEMLHLQEAESLFTVPDKRGILTGYQGKEGILKVRLHGCWGLVLPLVKRLQQMPPVLHEKCGDSCSCGCESMQSWIDSRKKVDAFAYEWLKIVLGCEDIYLSAKWTYMLKSEAEVDDVLVRALCEHAERMDNGMLFSVAKESLCWRIGGEDVSDVMPEELVGQWWAVVATAPCTFSVVTEKAVLQPWTKTLFHYFLVEIEQLTMDTLADYLLQYERDVFIKNLQDTGAKVILLKCKEMLEDAIKQGIDLVGCNEEQGIDLVGYLRRHIHTLLLRYSHVTGSSTGDEVGGGYVESVYSHGTGSSTDDEVGGGYEIVYSFLWEGSGLVNPASMCAATNLQ